MYILWLKVLDRENQMDNPCPWLTETAWDNVTELDKLANFHGIITSFEQYPRDWNIWYTASEPESAGLPGLYNFQGSSICFCYLFDEFTIIETLGIFYFDCQTLISKY